MGSDEFGKRKSAMLTPAQRDYLRREYGSDTTSDSNERALRTRIRQRVKQGIRDFGILFEHLSDGDLRKIFEDADPVRESIAELDEEAYLDSLTEDERTKAFGTAEIAEEDVRQELDKITSEYRDPYEFYEQLPENGRSQYETEDGEPDIHAIARSHLSLRNMGPELDPEKFYKNLPDEIRADFEDEPGEPNIHAIAKRQRMVIEDMRKFPREEIFDNAFRQAMVSAIGFLLVGADFGEENPNTDPERWDKLVEESIRGGLGRSFFDRILLDADFEYAPGDEQFQNALEKVKKGEAATLEEIGLLARSGVFTDTARFRVVAEDESRGAER